MTRHRRQSAEQLDVKFIELTGHKVYQKTDSFSLPGMSCTTILASPRLSGASVEQLPALTTHIFKETNIVD
jgi:hypothetical protein